MTYKRPNDAFDLMNRLDGAHLTLPERSVLWAQYKFADKNGTYSRASEERLAKYLNTSVRTIRRTRKSLREMGWLIERHRGRNIGDVQTASTYEVVIPASAPVPREKPKRVPNPTGRNQHTEGARGQICPEGLEDRLTKNPRSLEDRFNHLPTPPTKTADNDSQSSGGGSSGEQSSARLRRQGGPEKSGWPTYEDIEIESRLNEGSDLEKRTRNEHDDDIDDYPELVSTDRSVPLSFDTDLCPECRCLGDHTDDCPMREE